jgi:CRP-like cAMP-binding protein
MAGSLQPVKRSTAKPPRQHATQLRTRHFIAAIGKRFSGGAGIGIRMRSHALGRKMIVVIRSIDGSVESLRGRDTMPFRRPVFAPAPLGTLMADSNQTNTMLRSIPMFSNFSDNECGQLLSVMQPRDANSGDVIFHQGAQGDTLVVVMDGILRVEIADQAGNSATVATVQTGEVVGEMAVLDAAPRSASVVAATDCRLLELSRDGLGALRKSCPSASAGIVGAVIGDVTRRLRNVNKRIDKELDPGQTGKAKKSKVTLKDRKGGADSSLLSKLLRRFGR